MDHDDRVALPRASSTPPAHGVSDSERPPRLSQPLTTKPRRRAFIVPGPIPGQQVASLGGISRKPSEVARPSYVVPGRLAQPPPHPTASLPCQDDVLPPCSRVEELQAGQAHLPSPSTFSKPARLPSPLRNQVPTTASYAAACDIRSSASMDPLGYEITRDDRMPVFD
jgi:hypothetical protein